MTRLRNIINMLEFKWINNPKFCVRDLFILLTYRDNDRYANFERLDM